MSKLIRKLPISPRWGLAIKTLPFVGVILVAKVAAHHYGAEFMNLSSLFTAVISANVFLIGFLITGVLSDYKESEKIPGDLAAAVEMLADEALIIGKAKKHEATRKYLIHLRDFVRTLVDWFHKKERTTKLMQEITDFNGYFHDFESLTQANFIVRMKQEQNLIRKMANRIHTIRETSFLGTGYAIAEIVTAVLVTGLVFIKIEPFYEGVFFVSFVGFMLIYMIYFIRDLDNPFGYDEEDSIVENVSLKPLIDTQRRIEELVEFSKTA
jgi:predicted membrane chloride channel (bestrophin family)